MLGFEGKGNRRDEGYEGTRESRGGKRGRNSRMPHGRESSKGEAGTFLYGRYFGQILSLGYFLTRHHAYRRPMRIATAHAATLNQGLSAPLLRSFF